MKKKFIFCLLIGIMGFSAMAQRQARPYNYSIGGVLGFVNGITFKMVPVDNFAIQADLGFHFLYVAKNMPTVFTINPNFMYEKAAKNGFYWFIGAGLNLGYANSHHLVFEINDIREYKTISSFVSGVNLIGGVEYKFSNIPLSLQGDIRPGFFLFSNHNGTDPYFDYNFFNISARYTF